LEVDEGIHTFTFFVVLLLRAERNTSLRLWERRISGRLAWGSVSVRK